MEVTLCGYTSPPVQMSFVNLNRRTEITCKIEPKPQTKTMNLDIIEMKSKIFLRTYVHRGLELRRARGKLSNVGMYNILNGGSNQDGNQNSN